MILSVIIPIYNTEQYLERCIQSIINQSYSKLEIILIDDGSTDKSGEICDKLSKTDERIKVLHAINNGALSARKKGLQVASGEYVTFVDSDDWIESDMYQNMMNVCIENDADMVTSGLIYEWKDKNKILLDSVDEGVYSKDKVKNYIYPFLLYNNEKNTQGITASVSNKIFRKKIIEKIITGVNKEITLGEDGAIVYPCVAISEKIVVIHNCWYHYIQHDGSVMRSNTYRSFEKLCILKDYFYEVFNELQLLKDLESQIKHYVGGFLSTAMSDVYNIEMNKISYVFPYEDIPKNSQVVLYGAGKVGLSYFRCLRSGNYASVVSWVDRNYKNICIEGIELEAPESLKEEKYDYVVIAIENSEVARAIRKDLLQLGINEEKIIWKINRVDLYS